MIDESQMEKEDKAEYTEKDPYICMVVTERGDSTDIEMLEDITEQDKTIEKNLRVLVTNEEQQ